MNWYYVDLGKQAGPVSDEQLDELFRNGNIKPETLVWREGMTDWVPYSQATGRTVPAGAPAGEMKLEAVCAECGKIFPLDETIRYGDVRVCAACKPVFLQKLQEGASLNAGGMRYAGFWIRFAARFLDGLIIMVPLIIIMFVLVFSMIRNAKGQQPDAVPPMVSFLQIFIQLGFILVRMAYEIFFLGKYGATPGKMACKIHVVSSDGAPIGYGRATGRFFSELLSGMICDIGYIIAAFDNPQKRALHDHICNTRVVYK